jgi:hypothetical protein
MGLSHSPSIVSSNLVLALDPANSKSYVGSGVTIRDLLGISSAGTLINGPTYSSAFGGYLNYDGANDYTSISNSNPINLTDNVTFSMWCRMNDLTYGYYPLSKMTGLNGYEFGFDAATAKMFVGIRNNAGDGYKSAIASTTVNKNIWTHYTGTKSGVGVSIFINGEYSGGLALTYIGSLSNTNPFTLGSANGSYYTPCDISQVLLYSKKLSDEEIKQNYDATKKRYEYDVPIVTDGLILNLDAGNLLSYAGSGNSWVDVSKNNNIGLLVNGPTYSGSGVTGALVFDGTNDYVTLGKDILSTVYTISAWFMLGDQASNRMQIIFDSSYSGILMNKNGGEFYYKNVSSYLLNFSYSFNFNTWYNITAVNASNKKSIYINGSLVASIFDNSSYEPVNNFVIGSNAGSVEFLLGKVAEVIAYNRALRSSEIYQNFNAMRSRYGI